MLKNMLLYRILDPHHEAILTDWEELAKALAEQPATQPTASQWRTLGFDKPAPSLSDELVWSCTGGATLFTVYFHERQLPGATIRDHLNEKIRKIEEREQRQCYRKEIAQMKDDVIAALLPKAFIKHSAVNMLVMGDLLIIGASSVKKGEDCLSLLRAAIGALAVRPLMLKIPADTWLTDLMRKGGEGNLELLDTAKLTNSTNDSVSFKGIELTEDEPQSYLENGFSVQEIGLELRDSIVFKMTNQMIFKGIKFPDVKLEAVAADSEGDPAANLDGTLTIFLDAVTQLVDEMVGQAGEELPVKKATTEYAGDDDDLLEEAQGFLLGRLGHATPGLLQRKFAIGFNRALRTLFTLKDMGVLGEGGADGHWPVIRTGDYVAPDDSIKSAVEGIMAPLRNGGSLSINGVVVAETDEFGDPVNPTEEDDL